MSKLTDTVAKLAAPVIEKQGCTLWDVEYVKEAGPWYLRVYIDHPDGVSIDQCEAVSRELDAVIEERDLIPGAYTFEVSSAGAERSLKRPGDFEQFMGHLVEVKLYQGIGGRKEFLGNLSGYADGDVTIDVAGSKMEFKKSQVANVRLRIG